MQKYSYDLCESRNGRLEEDLLDWQASGAEIFSVQFLPESHKYLVLIRWPETEEDFDFKAKNARERIDKINSAPPPIY